jgi:hypothetical protein
VGRGGVLRLHPGFRRRDGPRLWRSCALTAASEMVRPIIPALKLCRQARRQGSHPARPQGGAARRGKTRGLTKTPTVSVSTSHCRLRGAARVSTAAPQQRRAYQAMRSFNPRTAPVAAFAPIANLPRIAKSSSPTAGKWLFIGE